MMATNHVWFTIQGNQHHFERIDLVNVIIKIAHCTIKTSVTTYMYMYMHTIVSKNVYGNVVGYVLFVVQQLKLLL